MTVFHRIKISLSFCLILLTVFHLDAQEAPPSAVGSMLTLLKSGRVPVTRMGTIVKLICDRGNEHDLRFIFDQAVNSETWPRDLRVEALNGLSNATTTRKVIPAGDLSSIAGLISSEDPELSRLAVNLTGQWKVEQAFDRLKNLASDPDTSAHLKEAAFQAMSTISADQTKTYLIDLIEQGGTFNQQASAIHALSRIDLVSAATFAADALQNAEGRDSPTLLLDGFLDQQGGSQILATEIEKSSLSPDMAKLALRHMFSIGRTDAELSATLSKIAGIEADPQPPTPEELAALVQEITRDGDPVRGEEVFRRGDLSCMKCHAVSKAGGQIGPDLSAIGASSPVEYVLMSVLNPDRDIKEAYTTKVVITLQGRVFQGLVADRTSNSLVLKDATGQVTSIPIDEIDEEIEGKSLMPKGLVKFMTHAELIDLGKFLSMLGKPGEFAVRSTQRMQRWRYLVNAPEGLLTDIPTLSSFEDQVLGATTWLPAYSRVNGALPIQELTAATSQQVVYVQGEINVSTPGKIQLELDSDEGITTWIGPEILEGDRSWDATTGTHPVTLRIDSNKRNAETVTMEFTKPSGSKAEFAVVDGQ